MDIVWLYSPCAIRSKEQSFLFLFDLFCHRSVYLYNLSNTQFFREYYATFPLASHDIVCSQISLIQEILLSDFGPEILVQILNPIVSKNETQKQKDARFAAVVIC